ncbi:MAG: GGDEF domain-containing protein [Ruminococcus flavefaciens]|nr:GGDEF domain-containing protein [Ruminococcus flavefaciens]
MDKKVTRVYFIIAALGIIGTIFSALVFRAYIYDRGQESGIGYSAVSWTDRMEMQMEDGVYLFSAILPEDIDEDVIAYDTTHMLLEVTIEGEVVYTLAMEAGQWMKTTGYQWNFISLMEEDAGKEIVFRVQPVYTDTKPKGGFYFGSRSAVEHLIVKERLFKFIITCLILIAGVVLLLYATVVMEKGEEDMGLRNFIIFAIMLGIWMICETQILELYIPCGIALVFLDHLMLMLMPLPFLLFLRHMYPSRDESFWAFCCYLNCGVVICRVLLQIIGISDLRETLWLTHIVLCVLVVCIFGLSVYEILKKNMTKQLKFNICGIFVLLGTIVLELAVYRLYNKSTPIGSMGFLFYVVIMGLAGVKKSRKIMEQAKESEIYRRLAFLDELTGGYNRTAFKQDLNHCVTVDGESGEQKISPTTLYMFDLNDLKKCNDNFGHEYGDQYIKMIAAGIRQAFEGDGKCYRIGGDEFCVIAPFTSHAVISQRLDCLRRYVAEKQSQGFVVPVSVAMGYAVYDPEADATLEDTMRRADDMMYQDKQAQKAGSK